MIFFNFEEKKTEFELGQIVLDKFNFYQQNKWHVTYSYDQIARAMGFKNTAILVEGIGFQFRILGENYSDLNTAMQNLANASGGKIPTKASFDAALRDEATKTFSFVDIQNNTNNPVVYVAAGIADNVLNGAQYVGDRVIDTGKTLLNFAPYLLLGGAALYIYLNVKAAPKLPKLKLTKVKV